MSSPSVSTTPKLTPDGWPSLPASCGCREWHFSLSKSSSPIALKSVREAAKLACSPGKNASQVYAGLMKEYRRLEEKVVRICKEKEQQERKAWKEAMEAQRPA